MRFQVCFLGVFLFLLVLLRQGGCTVVVNRTSYESGWTVLNGTICGDALTPGYVPTVSTVVEQYTRFASLDRAACKAFRHNSEVVLLYRVQVELRHGEVVARLSESLPSGLPSSGGSFFLANLKTAEDIIGCGVHDSADG